VSKTAHFLLISDQNARNSVHFCAFSLIFALFQFRIYALVKKALIKIFAKSLNNHVSKSSYLNAYKLPEGDKIGVAQNLRCVSLGKL